MSSLQQRVVIVIPTYNECENIAWIVERTLAAMPDLRRADRRRQLAGRHGQDRRRSSPRETRGSPCCTAPTKPVWAQAYLHGFAVALERGYDVIGEMDADGSHQPEQLPSCCSMRSDADLVIGSRWVKGGRVRNWSLFRKLLSVGGNIYARALLGIPVHDITAGFRLFRRSTLTTIDLSDVRSVGYCFQTDLTFRTVKAGLTVREVPIEFVERERGESKMSADVATESLRLITRWGLRERAAQVARAYSRRGETSVSRCSRSCSSSCRSSRSTSSSRSGRSSGRGGRSCC